MSPKRKKQRARRASDPAKKSALSQPLRTTSGQAEPDRELEGALISFLSHLATLLMSAGISAPLFNHWTNKAFAQAAAKAARLRNSRVNFSAVAAMSGLSRAEVRVLLGDTRESSAERSSKRLGIQKLVQAWRLDPAYTTSRLRPRLLSARGGQGSFSELVKKYAGDLPEKAVLRELSRRNLVDLSTRGIRLRQVADDCEHKQTARALVRVFGSLLSASAAGRSKKSISSSSVTIELRHPLAMKLLARHIETATPAFFESLKIAAEGLNGASAANGVTDPVTVELVTIGPA